jgi:hypothetical protein
MRITATRSAARSIRSHRAAFASPSLCVLLSRPATRSIASAAAAAAPSTDTPRVQPFRGLRPAPRRIHTRTAAAASVSDMNPQFVDRVRGALWGIFIADALSMPVHWYYDVSALKRDFGTITDYQAPKQRHPGAALGRLAVGHGAVSGAADCSLHEQANKSGYTCLVHMRIRCLLLCSNGRQVVAVALVRIQVFSPPHPPPLLPTCAPCPPSLEHTPLNFHDVHCCCCHCFRQHHEPQQHWRPRQGGPVRPHHRWVAQQAAPVVSQARRQPGCAGSTQNSLFGC